MPELPEVEIVRRGLEPLLVGQRFGAVERRRKDLRFPFPSQFAKRLQGCGVTSLARRAKYILAHLSSGDVLVMHLGMTGRFTVSACPHRRSLWEKSVGAAVTMARDPVADPRLTPRAGPAGVETEVGTGEVISVGDYAHDPGNSPKHDHVVLHMSNGTAVTYNDPRRFGFMLLIPQSEIEEHPLFAGLGVEPLGKDLNAAYLARRARGRRADLKAFLMDQRVVAGLGNIYVSEALHRAGLSPKRRASCLARANGTPTERAERLVPQIRKVLLAAIAAGGSTLRDYRQADGASGSFQLEFSVYDRQGEPCRKPGCGGSVRRLVQAGRSTFYCPTCQR